ncbi:putative oxidoreductase [Streptoalloteichus tenebrarius]|uniref:Oxidoreductase n=1 Tax=Streptoalloteichus tenebrarius (strain ATCC 17920 / DSM 40477 / JCM 4838 / CBS 697.72 / NBRC 16177 / NCIMB 11028 / NRRL B-12390 / A12253. 1 / ISP 5477) TaxID=1933 RepID=A0ABT1HQJ2_STRSD|nr:aldo/keto reductase [Streptoalloteichus tenebrarius]MCP2257785.1 putative oxidoreductase [Streptoalloteichus tenebrarius]BFE99855.1 aldo/keto reductase [Streptoalloteichus tenebrarius]
MRRRLGATGPEVGAVGLGCMGMSWGYAESQRDDDRSLAVIREAVERGVSFLDTAQVYGDGHNESLVGRAIADLRDDVVVATKTGLVVEDLAARRMRRDGTPRHVRASAEESLRRLGVEAIDLLYLHRVDPAVPLEETWGAMAELVAEGKARRLGLSEVTVAEAERAHAIHPVAAIQSELSLWTRDALGVPGERGAGAAAGADDAADVGDVVGWCAAHGAAFVPFSPLGRGFLTGTVDASGLEDGDFRATNPRFQRDAAAANERIVDVARRVAARHDATPAQVALAWVLARGEHVIPIPGTRSPRHLRENLAAVDLALTAEDLAELDSAPPPVGSRY